ncbi:MULTISPECIES: hypothetical protein [unclassified Thalassospira]|uniref:hypothetical protein n=1 Tax=unclassified Thalassospira TaxID=2648997 RepID=UPI001AFD7C38|nr:hypothetical protein [Thalassospira sp.]MBO6770803.1 hypothetical protein [Thalassospira sp.]
MSFDFNKKGKQYQFEAVGYETNDFECLTIVSQSKLNTLQNFISRSVNDCDPKKANRLDGFFACLEKYKSCLYYSKKIDGHLKNIKSIDVPKDSFLSLSAVEACIDFESFLFHGRSALDKLCLQINREFDQNSDRYSKLVNVLGNFPNNEIASQLSKIILESNKHFNDLLIDGLPSGKSLRSLQMHRSSIGQSTKTNFCIHHHPKRGKIFFDHYFLDFPLINTTWNLTKWIGYLILGSLSLLLENKLDITPHHCRPKWVPDIIPISDYETSRKGVTVTVAKLSNSGVQIINKTIKAEALDHSKKFI